MKNSERTDRPAAVYRYFGVSDDLIYVGVTTNPSVRRAKHITDSWRFWPRVVREEIAWFPTERDAYEEEARAIRDEVPSDNIGCTTPERYRIGRERFVAQCRQFWLPDGSHIAIDLEQHPMPHLGIQGIASLARVDIYQFQRLVICGEPSDDPAPKPCKPLGVQKWCRLHADPWLNRRAARAADVIQADRDRPRGRRPKNPETQP